MITLLCFVLAVLAAPFKSKSRLEAENAALRHQLIILQRKMQGRARLCLSAAGSPLSRVVRMDRRFAGHLLPAGRRAAIPPHERMAVVDHAIDSRGLSIASPETAAWLSLVAYVRHTFTDYDELLAEGYDPDSARHFVVARMDKTLQA
jgi:hypothetical protein